MRARHLRYLGLLGTIGLLYLVGPACMDLDGIECRSSTDCRTGESCFGNRCVEIACTSTQQCGPDDQCVEGACVRGCTDDSQCNGICELGACRKGCRSEADCAIGEICSLLTCVPGCLVDADCAAGELCDMGTCFARPCDEDVDCPLEWVCEPMEQDDDRTCTPGCRDEDVDGTCLDVR